MQKKLFTLLVFLFVATNAEVFATECQNSNQIVGVSYLITKSNAKTNEKLSQETLNFWRMGTQVAYEYPQRNYIEIWNLVSNGQIRPVRYFDDFKRGIEYQPMDVNEGKGDKNWSAKNNIVSDELRSRLKSAQTTGDACDKRETFLPDEKTSLQAMTWLSYYQLPQVLKFKQGDTLVEWQAQQIVNAPEKVQQPFQRRASYQTTDFADIGDSESDPIIRQLIKQGFIEHHGMQ